MIEFFAVAIPSTAMAALLYVFWPNKRNVDKKDAERYAKEAWRMAHPSQTQYEQYNYYSMDVPYQGKWEFTFTAQFPKRGPGLITRFYRKPWRLWANKYWKRSLPEEGDACMDEAAWALISASWCRIEIQGGRVKASWIGDAAWDGLFLVDQSVAKRALDRGQAAVTKLSNQIYALEQGKDPSNIPESPRLIERTKEPPGWGYAIWVLIRTVLFILIVVTVFTVLTLLFTGPTSEKLKQDNKKKDAEMALSVSDMLKKLTPKHLLYATVEIQNNFGDINAPVHLIFPFSSGKPRIVRGFCPQQMCDEILRTHAGKKARIGYIQYHGNRDRLLIFSISESSEMGEGRTLMPFGAAVEGYRNEYLKESAKK